MSEMRTLRGRLQLVACIGVVVLLAASCSKSNSTTKSSGSYTIGAASFLLTDLLPGKTGDSNLDYAVWTPLMTLDPKTGKAVNGVAKSMESTDQRVWTIKLNSGWTFHNGESVTAQSFADSWNASAYAPNAMKDSYLFAIIEGFSALSPVKGAPTAKTLSGVQVVDQSTLKVTLTKPLSLFPYIVAGTPFAPMPKAAFGNLNAFDKKPLGNGPYQVTGAGITPGVQTVTLQRYDKYAGEKAAVKQVNIKLYQNVSTAYTDFQAGRIDVTLVSGNDLINAANKYPKQLVRETSPAVFFLGFPAWDKRFSDLRVRQAFSLAIDRKTIVKSLLHGFGEPAVGLAPKTLVGGGDNSCSQCSYDPAKAKELLASAGGWSGSLNLWTYQDPTNSTVLQAISNQLRTNLGIGKISIQTQPVDQIYPNLSAHKIDGPFLLYMGAGYPHLYAQAEQLFTPGEGFNVVGYNNHAVTGLLDQAARSGDQGQVVSLTQQATKTALDDLPETPIYLPQAGLVFSKKLSNVVPEFLGGVHVPAVTLG